jgi:hypothetical protein
MAHRVSINFSDGALDTLEKLAREKSKSMSDVLGDAIALENYVMEAIKEGSHIFIERPDGRVRELITR